MVRNPALSTPAPVPPPPGKSTILIIGAGIAGPLLGLHIQSNPKLSARFTPLLIDRDLCPPSPISTSAMPSLGAHVVLAPNGLHPLYTLGLRDAVDAMSTEVIKLNIHRALPDSKAQWYNHLLSPAYDPEYETGLRVIERARLQSLLVHKYLSNGGTARWGCKIVYIEQQPHPSSSSVAVLTSVGERIFGDLVVGADGNWSRIRRAMLGEENWKPVFMGYSGIYGVADKPDTWMGSQSDEIAHAVMTDGGMAATWPLPGGRTGFDINAYAAAPPGENTGGAVVDVKVSSDEGEGEVVLAGRLQTGGYTPESSEALLQRYQNTWHPAYGTFGEVFRKAQRMTRVALWQRVWGETEIVDTKHGNAVLIGDAARVLVPASGQGACLAIEDATVLANALLNFPPTSSPTPNFSAALTSYAATRVPRSRRIARESAIKLIIGMGDRWWSGVLRDWMTWAVRIDRDNRQVAREGQKVDLGWLLGARFEVTEGTWVKKDI